MSIKVSVPDPNEMPTRRRCPFYGFNNYHWSGLLDNAGNQCGATTSGLYGCFMELAGMIPDWDVCGVNSGELAEMVRSGELDDVPVFPKEKNHRGVSLREWFIERMGREPTQNP